jgi:hypothetical protein
VADGEHVHVQQIRHSHAESMHGRPPQRPLGEPILTCRDVHYSYLDRYLALDGVDLTVHRG